jgi:hypothetical protein
VKSMEGDVQLSFRVKPERKRKVREWVAKHDTNMQALLERGLVLAMKEEKPSSEKSLKIPENFLSVETNLAYNIHAENEWLTFADFIFSTKNLTVIYGLQSNICAFLAMLDDDGVDHETDQIPPKNFTILLARARSAYTKLKLCTSRDRKTKTAAPESTAKKITD